MTRTYRIGIINLMPQAERYEQMLARMLETPAASWRVEPVWIRLETHRYQSSDAAHLEARYRPFDNVLAGGALDGLILTGAPVEELPFERVRYWTELSAILQRARATIPSTLGLCWGGMALAKLLGLDKERYASKLFGVYPLRSLTAGGRVVHCAQSRHAGISESALERARDRGLVTLHAHSPATGYTIFASTDGRYTMHLGHPEYSIERLLFEYRRDQALGRTDVAAPVGFDLERPELSPTLEGPAFFARWLEGLA